MGKQTKQRASRSSKIDTGKIDFLSVSKPFAILSVILTFASLVLIAVKGFHYGIDFAGGTVIQVQLSKNVSSNDIRQFMKEMGQPNATVQAIGDNHEFLIRIENVKGASDKEVTKKTNAMIKKITEGLKSHFKGEVVLRRVDSVGPQIGAELKRNGILAAFYCLLMILIYVGLRFDYKYAPGAVFCLFHDAIITLGIFSLINHEVNVQTMAAILTIIGYSLNDTIITFDRIRENISLYRDWPLDKIVNRSINDVLSRTILTSLTTLMAVAAMYFFADGVIQDFSFALGIGIIIGTYSSIYVASPLVLFVDKLQQAHKKAA
ncbi:MAG: protein translocase subunit SecF [Bdellovibrio sp.]|nr:MAG: protein translocase subunit SecF [Bdellovibrio sp.]